MKRSIHKIEWGLCPSQFSNFLFAWHPISPTFVWLLNCWKKKCSHARYPICPTTMMLIIPIIWLKRFFDIIPTHWSSKYFSIFYFILILCLYIKMKNKKKPLLSITGQSIPFKTSLRGKGEFSPYNEALHSCTKHLIKIIRKK